MLERAKTICDSVELNIEQSSADMLHIEQDQGLMIDILHEQDSFLSALKLLSRPKGAGNPLVLDTLADNLKRVDV